MTQQTDEKKKKKSPVLIEGRYGLGTFIYSFNFYVNFMK